MFYRPAGRKIRCLPADWTLAVIATGASRGVSETTETTGANMHAIPLRRTALVEALARQGMGAADAADFRKLAAFIGAYFHHDFYQELTEMKDLRARLDEAGDDDASFATLEATFLKVLQRGNFVELPAEEVRRTDGENRQLDVRTRTPLECYDTIRVFWRGQHNETIRQRRLIGTKETAQDVFDDVIVFIRFRKADRRKPWLWASAQTPLPGNATPGSVLIKSFRNIARGELPMLLPGVDVVMSRKDALLLGGPALIGFVPIALNVMPALSVVLVVLGALLGITGEVHKDDLMKALGALSALIGAGAFIFRQYTNYAFRRLRYQKHVADHVYFRNVNNDTGVFETLVGMAEEQEIKETILACHSLLVDGPVTSIEQLDSRVEERLAGIAGAPIDFEATDALEKLQRLDFLTERNDGVGVVNLRDALARLDNLWDGLYDYGHRPASRGA